MIPKQRLFLVFLLPFIISACQFSPYPDDVYDGSRDESDGIHDIGGNPSPGSEEIYATANLSDLCLVDEACEPDYVKLRSEFIRTEGQEPLKKGVCNFDYDPNLISTFVLNKVDGDLNGLDLYLSREDLFFLAWVSVRYKINPYFLLGILAQESRGNCSAVSPFNGEGCFQITNTFGQGQLNDSYLSRVAGWSWSDRSGSYYPDEIFVDETTYFGETPPTEQFRITIDPTAPVINEIDVSSVVNFHFGVIASALYFHWQHYLLYYYFEDSRDVASELFQSKDGKAQWQAAAYNGGAFGAGFALEDGGEDFLDEMAEETQNYAPAIIDYCTGFQNGDFTYSTSYTQDDINWIIDLLAMTYPLSLDVDWDGVKEEIEQIFFSDVDELTLVDDVKAIIYVISTNTPLLAPEWASSGSI